MPPTITPAPGQLAAGNNVWQFTSAEFVDTVQALGFDVSPAWQGYPASYRYLLINFKCLSHESLTRLYTGGEDMGLTLIHQPAGYPDVYLKDNFSNLFRISMIGGCWLAAPMPPEAEKQNRYILHFKHLAPLPFEIKQASLIDLGKICFVSERDGDREIYLMNPDGSEQLRLTYRPGLDIEPAWSPGQERIAFASTLTGDMEIYTMAGTGLYPVNRTLSPGEDGAPAWSPLGGLIAFHTLRDGNLEIYLMNPDGANQHNLTNNPFEDAYPAWSPNGGKIAFQSNRDGNWEIYTLDASGENLLRLTETLGDEMQPVWSPLGDHIAYWSYRNGVWRLYLMNADGSSSQPIHEFINPGPHPSRPAWSPDGRHLLFAAERDGSRVIFRVNVDGSNPILLTNNAFDDYDPCW